MLSSLRHKGSALLLATAFSSLVFANQIQFYDETSKFAVALSSTFLDSNATQILMQISAPVSYGWAALGSGSMMAHSYMFVVYPNQMGDGVTLSVRTTAQHNPPQELTSNTVHARVRSSSIVDGTMVADIVWQDDSPILNGVVDPRFRNQPFIWAVGPSVPIASDATNQKISKHSGHGLVFADMPQSQTLQQAIANPQISGTSSLHMQPQPTYYHRLVLLHVILMGAAFVVLFPFGVIGLRLDLNHTGFTIHWILQCLALLAVIGGLGVAVTMSILGIEYNHFTEPHQIVGLVVSALVGLQVFLGRQHHIRFRIYKKHTAFGLIHMGLGRIVIYGGTTNAVLGLLLCGRAGRPVIAIIAIGGVLAAISEFLAIRRHLKRRKANVTGERVRGYMSGQKYEKLKDVGVSEHEIHTPGELPLRRYQGQNYDQRP